MLPEVEVQYGQLLQGLPEAAYLCDREGFVRAFNEAAVELWGRTPVLGEDMWCGSWRLYQPDGTYIPLETCPMAAVLQGVPLTGEEEMIVERPDHTRRLVRPRPNVLRDMEGNIIGAINIDRKSVV